MFLCRRREEIPNIAAGNTNHWTPTTPEVVDAIYIQHDVRIIVLSDTGSISKKNGMLLNDLTQSFNDMQGFLMNITQSFLGKSFNDITIRAHQGGAIAIHRDLAIS